MVPAEPLSKRSKNFGTIPRRRRCLDGASNFGKEKSLDKAKARQAPSFHLSGWRGFYLRQNQIFLRIVFLRRWFELAAVSNNQPGRPAVLAVHPSMPLRPRLQRKRRSRTSFVPSRAETQQLKHDGIRSDRRARAVNRHPEVRAQRASKDGPRAVLILRGAQGRAPPATTAKPLRRDDG